MNKEQSLLEVAIELLTNKKNPQPIHDIIRETLELTGNISSDNVYDIMKQLYTDITTSAEFIYCKDDLWDLKERQSLELWDKDGAYYYQGVVEDDDDFDDGITVDDYSLDDKPSKDDDDDDDYYDEDDHVAISTDQPDTEIELDDIVDDDDDDLFILDDEVSDDEFLDEDTYNEYMDDYEDMYDED